MIRRSRYQFAGISLETEGTSSSTYAEDGTYARISEFVEVLPELLRRLPKVEVLIAGDDRVAYGARKPQEGSFGRWAQSRLKPLVEQGGCVS